MSKKPKKTTKTDDSNVLDNWMFFPSAVYKIKKPEFLEIAKTVSDEYLEKMERTESQTPQVHQTSNISDPRIFDFSLYIADTAFNILNAQGYKMENTITEFTSFWVQEVEPFAYMAQHVHTDQSQITGFYFLECDNDCSKISLYDPRPGKVQISLDEQDTEQVTMASVAVNFVPEPGLLVFFNSWLPHGFSTNLSGKKLKFMHFNLKVTKKPPTVTNAIIV